MPDDWIHIMEEDLKDRIRNFIVGWNNISTDENFSSEDCGVWINNAIALLTEVLEQ